MWDWLKRKSKPKPDLQAWAKAELASLPYDPQKRLQAALLCKKAIALVDRGQRQEALAAFQQAVVADPGYGLAWSDMGICLNELSRYREAAEALAKACDLEPNDFASWFQRAKACAALGRREEAREYLKKARRFGSGPELAELERQIG